jgi:hypothetical protein
MINAQALLFDAAGRIRNTTAAPTAFNAALGFANGLLSVDINTPQRWANGMPFMATGKLSVQVIGTVVAHSQGGLPINDLGAVAIDTSAAIAYYNAGLPYTAIHRLAFAVAE